MIGSIFFNIIIKKTDPTSFLKLEFIGRKNLKMEESDPFNLILYEKVYIYTMKRIIQKVIEND